MKNWPRPGLAVLATGAIILAACSTPAAPAAPTSAPAAPTTAAAAPSAAPAAAPSASATAAPSAVSSPAASSDAEWQKIVAAAKQEGKLLVYSQWFTGTEATSAGEEFKRVTGIDVDFITGNGAVLVQRYSAETQAGQASADVLEGSPQFLSDLRRNGEFVPLKGKPLPIFSDPVSDWRTPPNFLGDAQDMLVSRPGKTDAHLVINTNLLAPADYPRSYHELATDPKYKGKIGFNDPKSTGNVAAMFIKQGYIAKTVTLQDIWSFFNTQNASLYARPGDQEAAAARGEVAIAIGNGSDRLGSIAEANAPIKLIAFPDTPLVNFPQMMGVTKASKHPNAAMVFINWMSSKDGQTYIKKLKGSDDGPRSDVPSFVPDLLKGQVVGGGKLGPMVVAGVNQTILGSDLNNADVFQRLTDGISEDEFVSKASAFIQKWESDHGGPQSGDITIPQ